MGDELEISGSGVSSVATEELYEAARRLAVLSAEASGICVHLALVDDIVSPERLPLARMPATVGYADQDMREARVMLAELEFQARTLEWALGSAADGYAFVELMVQHLIGGFGSGPLSLLGAVVPALTSAAHGGDPGQVLSSALSTEAAVGAVRAGVMTADDTLLGLLGVPMPVTQLLGEDGLGITGVSFAAGAVMAVGSIAGVLRETPVALAGSRSLPVSAPPVGFAERFSRVPQPTTNDGSQVVIEKYEIPGEPDRFEVYIAGTVTFDPVADDEPWDMTSNMANAVGPGSGSYDSVALAMKQAGIDENSPVQFTGYSQGGGTAARLAASGDYNTLGLVTFGGPTGQVDLPHGVPTVIVEHKDDLVPALGGTQENLHAVIVERDVFDGRDIPQDKTIPAHHKEHYYETAMLMDAATDPSVAEAAARLDAFAPTGATVTSTAYRFERVSSEASARGAG